MHQQWSRWFADPEKHFYTRAGNRKPPSYSKIVKFVSDAVKELNSDTVKKSFRVCGIAEKGDRIELNELHGRLRTLVECKEEEKAEVLEGNSEDESESDDEIIPIDDGGDELQEERRMQPARGHFARFDLDRQMASTFPAHWKVGPAPVFWASQPLEPAEWLALLILKAGDVESNPGPQNRKLPPLRPDHSDNNTQFNNTLACNHITP